ncbi:MAG TPA: PKD domain-containing protein [Flavisolibacter sp.]
MKKIRLTLFLLLSFSASSFANHITGGEMYYTYQGMTNGNHNYRVTLKLYRDCAALATLDAQAQVAAYANNGSGIVFTGSIPLTSSNILTLDAATVPCISNPPVICYQVGFYEFTVSLPPSAAGYTISYQRCCRIAGIINIFSSSSYGATFSAIIPGTNTVPTGPVNNSAQFIGEDLVVVCADNPFTYNFGAMDADSGDSLVYSFDAAFTGGGQSQDPNNPNGPNSPAPNPPTAPPYTPLDYAPPFAANQPMGPQVSINPNTGLVTGIAPDEGIYVVSVYVKEYRNDVLIAYQRKDLQIKVADCFLAEAVLNPQYITCDGYNLTFSNNSSSPLIKTYFWTFGDPESGALDTSTLATPTHTFTDTGVYIVTLITNKGQECTSTATTIAKVYPGFSPGFTFSGICNTKPTQFFDTSKTIYGVIDSWRWDFGDPSTSADTSHAKDTTYTYSQTGPKTVLFTVTNSKGCSATIEKTIDILDRPPLTVGFKDTLICRGDQVQLTAQGSGVFTWTPTTNMINENSAAPVVSPPVSRTYFVELNDNGCLNQDSVRVSVANQVTVQAGPPAVICLTDSVQLSATTNGLRFEWTPAAEVSDPARLNPTARPSQPGVNTYRITSFLGGCTPATADFQVTAVPYPTAIAQAADDTICYLNSTQLTATISGTNFTWAPLTALTNATTLTPTASPLSTTRYVLTVIDPASGCPKPSRDTVTVHVLPKIFPFAGRDTMVVINEPLQFEATGGSRYEWIPATDLSASNIPNPVGVYRGNYDSIRYKVLVFNQDCFDSAFVTVKVFNATPQVFVPTGFSPNGDGKNDVIRPIAVGIKQLEYFRIFNRWGEMVFQTSTNGAGWDGRIKGKEQGTNVFVWIVKGVDYTGKSFFAKGTVTLIR